MAEGEERPAAGPGPRDLADRAAVREGRRHAPRCPRPARGDRGHPHRRDLARRRPRHRRPAPRARHRDLRPGVLRQDDGGPARGGRGAAPRRHRRLHRCRARPRPHLRQEARRRHGRAAHLPAGHRRAGPRDRRDAHPLERRGRDRGRLRRGARPARRAGRRHGRLAAGPAGAPHVAGPAQAHRRHLALGRGDDLHQPDPRKDRRHVWIARNPARAGAR